MSAAQRDRDIIAAHQARLRQLYITRAKMGLDTPPHVRDEIEEIEDLIDGQAQAQAQPLPFDLLTFYRSVQAELMRLDANDGRVLRELADLRKHIDKRFDRLLIEIRRSSEQAAPAAKQTPKPRRINGE
jgi:hypothetical protein